MPKTPTFSELMDGPYTTPRRTPILDHAAVVNGTIEWFLNKNPWRPEAEMALPSDGDKERRADIVAWNRKGREFYIVEAKAQWNDFVRDRKFFDYRKWCTWFAFAMPEELVASARKRMDEIPGWYEGVGLLVIPNAAGLHRMVRQPKPYKMTPATYTKMVEQWAASCRSRLVGARIKIGELEWRIEDMKFDLKN